LSVVKHLLYWVYQGCVLRTVTHFSFKLEDGWKNVSHVDFLPDMKKGEAIYMFYAELAIAGIFSTSPKPTILLQTKNA
jgi:hypothetical protein